MKNFSQMEEWVEDLDPRSPLRRRTIKLVSAALAAGQVIAQAVGPAMAQDASTTAASTATTTTNTTAPSTPNCSSKNLCSSGTSPE